MDLKDFIVNDEDTDSQASYQPSDEDYDTSDTDGSDTFEADDMEIGESGATVFPDINADPIEDFTDDEHNSNSQPLGWQKFVTDPFTGDPLPAGIMNSEKLDKIVASYFCPHQRVRRFQVVWKPYSGREHPEHLPNTTWCTYQELANAGLLNRVVDEDGMPVENYCYKNQQEYDFYCTAEYATRDDNDTGYVQKGRCNALIWNSNSKIYDQRCPNHTVVEKTCPNYVPYCAHHHHALHSPDVVDKKRFFRNKWINMTLTL